MNCWHLQFGVEGNIGGDLGLFIELWSCSGCMVSDGLASHPGGLIMEITPSHFMLQKPG